ncbi:hypothetical protein [Prochlorococcus sp. MIT 1011]|uniref:hypothetical protein n=1 Tax=Prochlorococcus sp. MIT 1011 TaxID=3082520 RepID=UPI0039B6C79D
MSNSESREERKKRFKNLSSAERKMLIRKKLELQGLTEGSGVMGKDQSSYDKEEMIDLILLTRCFQKNKFQ